MMIPIAPHITAFLRERLPLERGASEHTCDSYAYAFRLLFEFASKRLSVQPSALCLEQIDADLVLAFLLHLESDRNNRPSSRNVRLAAIRSFMHFVEHRVPSALDQIRRILAIPVKKTETRLITHLTPKEMQTIVDAPNPSTRDGIRDRAMLHMCFTAGLRVSELVGLRMEDVRLQPITTILVHGKGRRERGLPLCADSAKTLRAWLAVRGQALVPELFLNARGAHMTRSGFEYVLEKHVKTATKRSSSLALKKISPHTLRHSCALTTLQATRDIRKVSLWLGHASIQTTEIYTRTDPSEKLEAIEAITPPALRRGKFRPPDKLIALLKRH
jgi:site-specific recombinase XerD